ncbi:MAG: PDZ domain-containing protein [Planctomycetes bacterium]|nr:PDZ domain-containing protein [Planctomycetota bacterium]
MKREVVLWGCVALLAFGSLSQAGNEKPYLGISMDSAPLPDLLTKHLRLELGQGIRINNIVTGSPADQAGLERDDIIVALDGHKIMEQRPLAEAVRKAGVGTVVTLEVIHLGQRQTLPIKLEPVQAQVQWKYPPEPEAVMSWRPGKIFRIGPNGREEMSFDKIPDVNVDVQRLFKEMHTYHHVTDGEQYTITIEGDPQDKNSPIVVQAGGQKHETTVGRIEALPEKYREAAREAVESARQNSREHEGLEGGLQLPDLPPSDSYLRHFQDMLRRPDLDRLSQQKDLALEKLQEQMKQMQQQMQELRERNREMFDRLLDQKEPKRNPNSDSNPNPGKATPSESKPSV